MIRKKNIKDAGASALKEHFVRKGVSVQVSAQHNRPGFYDLKFNPINKITIIIEPFASDAVIGLFTRVLLSKTRNPTFSVQLIIPYDIKIDTDQKNVSILSIDTGDMYLSGAMNRASGDVVVMFNQPYLPRSKTWLEQLSGVLNQEHVKVVAPIVIRDDGVVQDCGLVYDNNNILTPLFKGQAATNNQTFFGNTSWVRNVDGVTGSVAAVRRKDLLKFIKSESNVRSSQIVKEFSLGINDKYNVIYTPVVFDNNSLEFGHVRNQKSTHFNSNLSISANQGYVLYSPESTVINMLMRIAEAEGILL